MSDFSEIISHVRSVASNLETDAAYAGGWDDNGAGKLREQIYIFECGLAGVLPSGWEKYKQEIEAKRDPDRAAYERYKKKYG